MSSPRKKPPRKKASKSNLKHKKDSKLSEKMLASNYFSDQQKRNKRLKTSKPKKSLLKRWRNGLISFRENFFKGLRVNFARKNKKRALKKDLRIRKKANYLSDLPNTRFKRFLHKLHPRKFFGFIFSVRGLILGIKIAIFFGLSAMATMAGLYLYYRQDVPTSIASLQSCIEGQTTEYYDRTNQILLWSSKSDFDCQPVQLEEINSYLVDALITVEDRDFYKHSGLEFQAILRAAYHNLRNESTQGGSTITQQYIKNAILQDSSRTFDRKIKEVILAIELERTFEKDEILTAYLNTVSFGSIYNGIEAASRGYFDKPAADLTLDESALLVAALPAPTTFWNDPERHVSRQKFILNQMLVNDVIDKKEYDKAIKIDTLAKAKISHGQYENIKAPHFVLEAEKRLTEELCGLQLEENPEENCDSIRLRGYRVVTTLDLEAQSLAEQTVDAVIPTIADRGFDNAALVAVDVETGKVIAQVGSRDFKYEGFGQTNTVTQLRDPGSTFKIFDYAALIEDSSDWGPGSIFYDYETIFDNRDWAPSNYSGGHAGPITMRKALGRSLNITAVKAMYIAGIDNVHNFAYQSGIRTELPCTGGCGLASAFGGGAEVRLDELTNAYATFSRGGVYTPLTYIDRVLDGEGKLLRQWRQRPERVFKAETAFLLNHMLADTTVRYSQIFNLDPGVDTTLAIKTGTDDNFINNHIVGYSKSVALGAWIGNHDEAVLFDTERNTSPPKALMMKTFMEAYHRNVVYEKRNHWAQPAGIKKVKIDLLTGYQVSNNAEAQESERFNQIDIFPSWYTPKISPQEEGEIVEIDTVSGKLATKCTPPQAVRKLEAVKIKNEIKPDDPFYDEWQEPIIEGLLENLEIVSFSGEEDDLHKCSDKPPEIEIISKPEICYDNCLIEVRVKSGTFNLEQLKVTHNNQIVADGSIPVDGRDRVIAYTYRPLQINSPIEVRGALKFEIIDKGLYNAEIDVLLEIDGFPSPQIPTGMIFINSIFLDPDTKMLKVDWDRPARDLELNFAQDCSDQPPIYIDTLTSSIEIDVQNYTEGTCEIFLVDSDLKESNRQSFEIDFETEARPRIPNIRPI